MQGPNLQNPLKDSRAI